jgi:hypothetical protein
MRTTSDSSSTAVSSSSSEATAAAGWVKTYNLIFSAEEAMLRGRGGIIRTWKRSKGESKRKRRSPTSSRSRVISEGVEISVKGDGAVPDRER